MVYLLLNCILLALLVYFAHYLDTRIRADNFEVTSFALSILFFGIEAALFIITLFFTQIWLDTITTTAMKLVFCFDAVFFCQLSSSFISIGSKKHKSLKIFIKILFVLFALFIIFFKFKSIELNVEKGVIIESEYLFSPAARQFFPWTWVTLYTALYRYILPVAGYLSLLILQEYTATQIEKYQTYVIGLGIVIMWITNMAISFIAPVSPSFTLLYMFAYLFMIVTLFSAWTKTSVPSGKGILVTILKAVLSYIIPAIIIGALCFFVQPLYSNFKAGFIVGLTFASILLVGYSLGISEILSNSTKFYTADYANTLENGLASIDYTNGEMDQIANRMFEIVKKNTESSSMNVYILTSKGEMETAYSSNNSSMTFQASSPLFDSLLNINRSVVVYSEIEKEHDLAVVHDQLEKFFETTKSDALFLLNEGHNLFGLITFGKKVSGDHYKTYDKNVFEKLYSYFFVFGYFMRNISNKDVIGVVNREIKMSSQIITSIQENIDKINNRKIDVGYLMIPAHNIGGEFIDFIRLTDTRHLIVVGDLSGKGIAASMNMVILKSIIRTYLSETHDFKQLVVKVNSFIRDSLRKGTIFMGTFALIDFETDTLYYINCGIPALMLYTQVYNNVIEIQGSGHVLGFVKDISPFISVKSTKLNPGDIILACTDGLIQSHSLRGEQFGKERVQQAILDNSTYPAQRMAQFTFDGLTKFMSKEMEDDVSILVLKYGGNIEDVVIEEVSDEDIKSEDATEVTESSDVAENTDASTDPFKEENSATYNNDAPEENLFVAESEVFTPEETIEEQSAVEPEKTEEVPEPKQEESASKPADMGLPEGFDMPDLSDLDSLLKEAGL